MTKIKIVGAGAFGTALAQQLAQNKNNQITLIARDPKIVDEICQGHKNEKYFPGKTLDNRITADTGFELLNDADVVFLALPSHVVPSLINQIKSTISPTALLVNLAKGIMEDGGTVVSLLETSLPQQSIATLKGPSFSAEMIQLVPTMMTLGYKDISQLDTIDNVTKGCNIFIDYTTDIKGVEYLSALKNIYAILIGHVDACFNASNTRFLIFTKAIGEIKILLTVLGGRTGSLFLSCGIGDVALTSLNDLSRNRTLGLLIGKGFFPAFNNRNPVVLEGIKTLKLLDSIIDEDTKRKLPLFNELVSLLVTREKQKIELDFKKILKSNFTTVLTYGTFDLIHYGHLELLRRAKNLGDRLIVGLSTDEFNQQKGKTCAMNFAKRKEYLESLQYVDFVIPETNWEQKIQDIQKYKVDLFIMGDDWKGKFDFLKGYCEVKYLPRTRGISTTELKTIRDTDQ